MTRENEKTTLTKGITSHEHYLYLNIECKTQLNKITIISHVCITTITLVRIVKLMES